MIKIPLIYIGKFSHESHFTTVLHGVFTEPSCYSISGLWILIICPVLHTVQPVSCEVV